MADQFKAEAGVEYINKASGQKVQYTADQLRDPATGMLSSQFSRVVDTSTPSPAPAPTSPAPTPTPTAPTSPEPAPMPEQSAPAQPQPTQEQASSPAPEQPQMAQHQILSGDNLTKIANKYGVSVQSLLAANPQITNPNLIYAGQSLNIPQTQMSPEGFKVPEGYERISGVEFPTTELQRANFADVQADPTNTFLYGRRIDPAASINDEAQKTYDLLNQAGEEADSNIRGSEKEKSIEDEIRNILGLNESGQTEETTVKTSDGAIIDLKQDKSALDMYNELMKSDSIMSLQSRAGDIQEKLDKLDASEVALRNDIRKEVEGEAPQSYIDAKVAERMKDIYPQKLALQAELRNVVGQLQGEKENAANILQYTMQDENMRYNRLFQYLQFETQQSQNAFSNKLQLFNALKDLPSNRSITVGGVEYKGINEDANLNVVQFTDANNNITVAGIDKATGEIKYSQVIGKAKSGSSGSGAISLTKQYSEMVAGQNIDNLQKIQSGEYATMATKQGTIIYDKSSYDSDLEKYNTAKKDKTGAFGDWWPFNEPDAPSVTDYIVSPPSDLK